MKEINVFDYATEILTAVSKGVLITTKDGEGANTMTISWGSLGIEWGKPIFTTFVRTARYTHELLEKNGEFTVSIPMGEADAKITGYCGSHSGRDVDKLKECGLTAVPAQEVSAPALKEYEMTLECRVLYKQEQDTSLMSQQMRDQFYRPDAPNGNDTSHIAYAAEIVKAYIS